MLKKAKPVLMALASIALLGAGASAWAEPRADGKLAVPADIAGWPVAGTTYAVSYEGGVGTTFNTVRIDPQSYAAYLATGNFPAGTMLALEVRAALADIAPAKSGHVQGQARGHSLHVKDEKAGPGTWTFYSYADGEPGTAIGRDADCYSCHQREARQDTVFTQFYPSLLEARAKAAGR